MWVVLDEGATDRTERMDVEGGYLVRSVWRHDRSIGGEPMGGSSMVFVPVTRVTGGLDGKVQK